MLKWNTLDKVATQVLYAVTGIILAKVLAKEAFGLVGAVLVFQSVALLFVDSGFGGALLQRKNPTKEDYSTVFWFNMAISTLLYVLLYISAPFIAWVFNGEESLIPLSRVMFITIILTALSIIQTNIFYKRMEMKMVVAANSVALVAGGITGIWMALTGWEAWAIVWQNIAMGAAKAIFLWTASKWRPMWYFSMSSLKSFFKVGSGIMGTSALNVLFQNINSLVIGNRSGMLSLSYYTQADKWSKMGIASMSQVINSSLPMFSQYQNDPDKFAAATAKMNRLSAYLIFPALGFLAIIATPLFHALFNTKWDDAIPLFRLLLLRGAFQILVAQYTNYLLARAKVKKMFFLEILRDSLSLVAIVATLPFIELSTAHNAVLGLEILLAGQVASQIITWVVAVIITAPETWRRRLQYITDMLPYIAEMCVAAAPMMLMPGFISNPWLLMSAQIATGALIYMGLNLLLKSKIQKDILSHLLK